MSAHPRHAITGATWPGTYTTPVRPALTPGPAFLAASWINAALLLIALTTRNW